MIIKAELKRARRYVGRFSFSTERARIHRTQRRLDRRALTQANEADGFDCFVPLVFNARDYY